MRAPAAPEHSPALPCFAGPNQRTADLRCCRVWCTCKSRPRSRSLKSSRGERHWLLPGPMPHTNTAVRCMLPHRCTAEGGAALPPTALPCASLPPLPPNSEVTNQFGFRFVFDLRRDQWGTLQMPKQVLPGSGALRGTPLSASLGPACNARAWWNAHVHHSPPHLCPNRALCTLPTRSWYVPHACLLAHRPPIPSAACRAASARSGAAVWPWS